MTSRSRSRRNPGATPIQKPRGPRHNASISSTEWSMCVNTIRLSCMCKNFHRPSCSFLLSTRCIEVCRWQKHRHLLHLRLQGKCVNAMRGVRPSLAVNCRSAGTLFHVRVGDHMESKVFAVHLSVLDDSDAFAKGRGGLGGMPEDPDGLFILS
jgi:hypothetical protein